MKSHTERRKKRDKNKVHVNEVYQVTVNCALGQNKFDY